MNAPDSKIAISVGKISALLIKQNLIKDDEIFVKTLSNIAKKHIILETPPKVKPTESPKQIPSRLYSQSSQKQDRLDKLRKQLDFERDLSITDKPTINAKSKEIVKFK